MKIADHLYLKTPVFAAFVVLMAAALTHADFVTDTIPAGTNPFAVAVN